MSETLILVLGLKDGPAMACSADPAGASQDAPVSSDETDIPALSVGGQGDSPQPHAPETPSADGTSDGPAGDTVTAWGLWARGFGGSGLLADHGTLEGPDSLAALAGDLTGLEKVLVVVPGVHVATRLAQVPAKRDAEARAAVPYVLEDDLAQDPDDLHFAIGPASEDGERPTAVVHDDLMARWRSWLAPFADVPVEMVPDYALLAEPGMDLTVALWGQARALVRASNGQGAAVEADLLPVILPAFAAGEAGADARRISIHADRSSVEGLPEGDITWAAPLDDRAVLILALRAAGAAAPLNLLQGAHSLGRASGLDWPVWRRAAALAAGVVLLLAGLVFSQAVQNERLAERLHAQTEDVFREAFPDVRRVVNPRAQLRSKLQAYSTGGGDRYLQLTSLLYQALDQSPAVEVNDLRYYDDRGEIGANVAYGAYGDLERLKATIGRLGGRFGEGGSRQSGDRILGDITVGMR